MHKSSLSIILILYYHLKGISQHIYISDQLLQYYSNTKLNCASLPQKYTTLKLVVIPIGGKWSKFFVFHLLNLLHIYVRRKVWIGDCTVQTMDQYFVQEIHGLRVHVISIFYYICIYIYIYLFIFCINPCTYMACLNQLSS